MTALAAALASGCAHRDDPVAEAARTTLDASAWRASFGVVLPAAGGGGARFRGSGAFLPEEERARLLADVSEGRATVGEAELLVDGDEVYVRASWIARSALRPWFRFDDADELDEHGAFGLAPLAHLTPVDVLSLVEAGGGDAERVGPEGVGGDEVERYRLEVDLSRAAERPALRVAARRLSAAARASVLPAEVVLDGERRVRSVRIGGGGGGGRPRGPMLTAELRDFGGDVEVELPEDERVVDVELDGR